MTLLSFDDTNGNGITRDAALNSGDTFDSRVKNTSYGGTGGANVTTAYYQGNGAAGRKVGSTGGHGFTVGNYTSRDTTTATYRTVIPKCLIINYRAINPAGIDYCIGSGTGAAIGNNQHWWTVGDDGTIPAPGFEHPAKGGFIIKPIDATLRAFRRGESGTPDETAMLNHGLWVDLSNTGGTDRNLILDSPDFVETGFHVVGGTGADPAIQFQDFVDEDEGEGSTNFARAGLWQTLEFGVFQFFGRHEIGRTYGNTVTQSEFDDSFKTIVCPGGYVREGFNALEWDIGNASTTVLMDNITVLGTGRTSIKMLFDADSTANNGNVAAIGQIEFTGADLQTGEQVLYDREGNTGYITGGAGNGESQLVTGTTGEYYYAIRINVDRFYIASSLANALAGTWLTLTPQADEQHSLTRTPDTRPDIIVTGTAGTWDFNNGNLSSCRHITLQTNATIFSSQIITSGKLFLNGGTIDETIISAPTVHPGEAFIELIDTGFPNITDNTFNPGVQHRGPGHCIEVTSATGASTRNFIGNTILSGLTALQSWATYSGTDFPFDGSSATIVDTTNNDITITAHPYTDGELVYYEDNGGTAIAPLTDGGRYYIGDIDANTVALYFTRVDAIADTNRISLTAVGTGTTHRFDSANAFIHNNSGQSFTLAVSDGTTPSVRNTGAVEVTVTNNVTLTFSPLELNTEVRVYNDADPSIEYDGVENSGASFAATAPASVALRYSIINPGFNEIRVEDQTFTTSVTVLVNQAIDRNFDPVD